MVEKCGYLPLAISLLGGVLRKKNTMDEWELVNKDIKKVMYGDEKQIEGVLNLSYENLPYYLKPCFLYMGIFNKDETIDTCELYNMWIAQGMISYENIGDKEEDTLMDIAELYLTELASSSLVEVTIHYSYDVAYRTEKYDKCKLHDVVRELCLKMGKREDFGLLSLEYQGGKLSTTLLQELSSHRTIRHLVIRFRSEVEHELTAICKEDVSKGIRSLQLNNLIRSKVVEFPPRMVDFQKFKLLRDLVIVGFKFEGGKLPSGITKLVHLRRLCLQDCELNKLPPSIRNLVYMDTLDLEWSWNVQVPSDFKDMFRLRHLNLPYYDDEKVGNHRLDEGLDGLESLKFLDSRYHEFKCVDRMMNLRRCAAIVHNKESLSDIMNTIKDMNKIVHCLVIIESNCDLTSEQMLEKALTCPNLHDLGIRSKLGNALAGFGSDLMSSKIRCLNLDGSEIEDDPMGILGKLPCLIILRIHHESFVGEEMRCPANSFPRLKRLVLTGLPKLREFRVEAGAMPRLFKLTIGECSCLEMLPEGLSGISTLQKLVIKQMPELRKRVSASGQDFHKVRHVPSIRIKD